MPDHIFVDGWIKRENYTYPGTVRNSVKTPARDRFGHGTLLKRKMEQAWETAKERKSKIAIVSGSPSGIYLEFESDEGFPLALERLDLKDVQLISVKKENKVEKATVFIPEGKVQGFLKKFEDYLSRDTRFGKPQNKSLVESIADLRLATIKSLWTEPLEEFPEDTEMIWWEVWLRNDSGNELHAFQLIATQLDITIGTGHLSFPDRSVLLAFASPSELSQSIDLFGYYAELRKAKELPNFFIKLKAVEQMQWIDELTKRTIFAAENATAICVLDTGINRGHPLLVQALTERDLHTFDPRWQTNDHHGHGTQMAGIALYGDLASKLTTAEIITLGHRLESAKIMPPDGFDSQPELYGLINANAAAQVETEAPQRRRVFLMAVTAPDQRDRGLPTSWSAELDALAAAAEDQKYGVRRLFVLSAGNTTKQLVQQYFDNCLTDSIHDPGQSWNALTVGAFTERALIDTLDDPQSTWTPLAKPGELCPTSTTSTIWQAQWPIKPDIVMEGGNYAISHGGEISSFDSLSLLTTYHQVLIKFFTTTGDTSGAAALAANMAAVIQSRYPQAWPETIRAIMVHSARWSEAMKSQSNYDEETGKNLTTLLRCFGYGTPSIKRALESVNNALTLIAQERIFPYEQDKSKEMILHTLPWPRSALLALGDADVQLRVTLSYFVEPNPGRRGWTRRHRYASHGLRFDVKTPTETVQEFRSRLNKQAREEDAESITSGDHSAWTLGRLRNKGSIHSDIWKGSAADLAERGYIGVYPVSGWWRERHQLNRWQSGARYALVVSLETNETEVDFYVPVQTMVESQIPI